jgi:hypothetical protein
METLTKVKSFLSSWRNLLALGTLAPLGIWIYSRVWMVNPAILGDEYLYSMNSRKAAPWDPSPAGDFSNYLFNFVYQGTNLCGQAFYSCAKVFNLFFFLGFIFTLFIVAIRFLPFWPAYGFMIVAALSPLSVYTSMFLPESMYMFFIGLLLIAVLHAIKKFTWQNWVMAGAVIGIASLVKPHAWLSAIAVGITFLVVGLGNHALRHKRLLIIFVGFVVGAALSRLLVGLLVAGPKALGFFGQYFGAGTVQEVVEGATSLGTESADSNFPILGVIELFGPQFLIHLQVICALMAIFFVSTIAGVIEIIKTRRLTETTSFALFSLIWLISLMVEIVIFTGWVTGTGDDHTTRVLLRYYEFLFVILPLAGLSVLYERYASKLHMVTRWGLAISMAVMITPPFTGSFGSLTIQIADAPTLAGLVVNNEVFNGVAILGFLALLVFATFPRYVFWISCLLLPISFAGTGFQIQQQYQGFRGSLSAADYAGQYLRQNFNEDEINSTLVVSSNRFDATNVAIWADSPLLSYELYSSGSQLPLSLLTKSGKILLTTNDITILDLSPEVEQKGFRIYRLPD